MPWKRTVRGGGRTAVALVELFRGTNKGLSRVGSLLVGWVGSGWSDPTQPNPTRDSLDTSWADPRDGS